MSFNVWSELSLGVIVATMLLQIINFRKFSSDGSNSTRITLMIKECFFIVHAWMLMKVSIVVAENFTMWFGQIFGMFYFLGLCCLFAVYAKGFAKQE